MSSIDREDTIKILKDLQKDHLQFCLIPFRQAIERVQALPSADRPQEWIPCSERLPELTIHENEPFIGEWDNSEPVLIYHKDNKYEYPYLIAQYTNGFENNEVGWAEMNDANEVIDVMAWMPLPEPIDSAPSIDIVRCGECKMWMSEHLCQWWSRYGTVETDADDFCSYGERENDE